MKYGQVQEFILNLESDIHSDFKQHKVIFNNSNQVLQGALLLSDEGIMVQQSDGNGGLGTAFLLGTGGIDPNDFYLKTTTLNDITLADGNVSLNNNKITNLSDATSATDALNRQTGDSRYYLNTTPINNITLATGSLSLNSNRITNLANAISGTDALNRQSGDTRYYLNTTPLNNITVATGNLDMNTHRINNVVNPILNQDAATKAYVDSVVPSSSLSILKALMLQTQTTNVALNDHVKFDTIEWSRGTNITLDVTAYPNIGRITLLAGSYILTSDMAITTPNANDDCSFQIWNVTDNTAVTQGIVHKIPISSNEKTSSMGAIHGVFTLGATKVIEVRIVQIKNLISHIDGLDQNSPAWVCIQQI